MSVHWAAQLLRFSFTKKFLLSFVKKCSWKPWNLLFRFVVSPTAWESVVKIDCRWTTVLRACVTYRPTYIAVVDHFWDLFEKQNGGVWSEPTTNAEESFNTQVNTVWALSTNHSLYQSISNDSPNDKTACYTLLRGIQHLCILDLITLYPGMNNLDWPKPFRLALEALLTN